VTSRVGHNASPRLRGPATIQPTTRPTGRIASDGVTDDAGQSGGAAPWASADRSHDVSGARWITSAVSTGTVSTTAAAFATDETRTAPPTAARTGTTTMPMMATVSTVSPSGEVGRFGARLGYWTSQELIA
jgi:hypothetical protein